ncbi:hypothetical protein C8Q75DRAFT_723772 [Abortiporus biennis]|nr:hypothetical protein C8Q75DRAFT_723772 [Abortiporus biennis]
MHDLPVEPPMYSPSPAVPDYTLHPDEDEERLDYSPVQSRTRLDGIYTKETKLFTIIFFEQDPDVVVPTYSRRGAIKGELHFHEPKNVISVTLKLSGTQSINVDEHGIYRDTLVYSETHRLLESEGDNALKCPSILPFSTSFPREYIDSEGRQRLLPPSFNATLSNRTHITAGINYSLTVNVVTKGHFGGWKRQEETVIPIRHHPRSRGHLPIADDLHPFLETVKVAPDEWHQVISEVKPKEKSLLRPLECHLFIPSVLIYAVNDTIPFHLQISGSPDALQAFFSPPPPPSPKRSPRISELLLPGSSSFNKSNRHSYSSIRVYLVRQVIVIVDGFKTWDEVVIGEGKIWSIPLPHQQEDDSDEGVGVLNFEGVVKCDEGISVGGFSSQDMIVKDFIALEMNPQSPDLSQYEVHRHRYPIRFVTDSARNSDMYTG